MQWIKVSQNKSAPWLVKKVLSSTGLRLGAFFYSFYAPDVFFTF